MDSKKDPSPIPRIQPPMRISSPNEDLSPCTPARSASPITPTIRSTTPTYLLRTPPVEVQLPSRGRTRIDTNGEGSARSPRSSSRATRTTSPSGNRSTNLSPSISSGGGGSYFSSDTGRSPCSLSSSDYLTPPQFQIDCEKRPYKARRGSSDSLNMMRKPKRANTMPHAKMHKSRRRHRHRKHRCHPRRCHKDESDAWHHESCQVAPTAPKGMKDLCIGHIGKYKPQVSRRGNTDTYGRILPRLWSDPAPPLVSRRWSSVEIGSHQIRLASTLPTRSVVSVLTGEYSDETDEHSPSHRLGRPYRSSTFTRGAIDGDIVRTVREKLTVRKIPSPNLQTPTTITLRRASCASARSGMSTVTDLLTPTNGGTGSTTPRPYPITQAATETDTAYLITSKDIDSITELIEANLRRNYRPHNRISAHPPVTPPISQGIRSPTSNLKILLPPMATPAVSTVSSTQAKAGTSSNHDGLSYLRVTSPTWSHSKSTPKSPSQNSNEVIWEASGSPNSQSSVDDRKRSSTSDSSRHQSSNSPTPHAHDLKSPRLPPPRQDKGDAFDPNNARASISEWSWRLPQAEVPTIITSSDPESNDFAPDSLPPSKALPKMPRTPIRAVASAPDVPRAPTKAKRKISARPALTSPEVEDVVFFPPLPTRKTTNEWFSPLPDIGSHPPKSPSPKSLYDEGIDATGVIATSLPAPKAQKHTHFAMMERLESPTSSVEFDPGYDLRRKSVVKAHPQAPARVGTQASMGSSIGASSGERRKSSVKPGVKRVRTIDNANRPSRAGTWTRNRPPSVCPTPIAASPAEISDNEDSTATSPPSTERIGRIKMDRKKHDISPPLPKMDRAGIYTKITGTVRSALGLVDCEEDCPPKHECDDCARDPRSQPSVDWIG
jgi:hypothetical protein